MELLDTIQVGAFQCNCSLLACPETKEAVLVDPGADPQRILDMVRHHGVTVKALVHTHAHLDHIGATRDMKEALGADICLHRDDLWLYEGLNDQGSWMNMKFRDPLPVDRFLNHDDKVAFGGEHLRVLHTPGHTPGSVCFHTEKLGSYLFSGDTLFQRSIGRTDLPGGNFEQELQSIRERLWPLDPDTQVLPGHGPMTSIGDERRSNPFLQG